MPRKPKKVTANDTVMHVTLLLSATDVRAIDGEAKRRSGEDAYGRTLTRSDVIRMAVHKFLEKSA